MMSLHPGQQLTLTIEKPAAGGRMLARHDGQVVFVAGCIPGERVRARVGRVAKQVAFADTTDVLEASGDRRSVEGDWACGGSLYAHINYERQLSLKAQLVADSFARIAKLPLEEVVPVAPSPEHGYRMRARLHAVEHRFGFFREGTHELCDVASTRQLLPETVQALGSLELALANHQTKIRVTACELAENVSGTGRAVLLETDSLPAPPYIDAIPGISGLVFSTRERTQATVAYGSPYVMETLDVGRSTANLNHHVESFFQGNRYLLAELVKRVLTHVRGARVIDLYAGVGLFAVSLAARGFGEIVAVEGDRASGRDLTANAATYEGAIRVAHMSVEDFLSRREMTTADTLLLDPPRTGVSREAMSGILNLNARTVVYISCDLATLARDVRKFVEVGYRLDHLEALDLFPNTAHVETVAVLAKTR
jgi:tRNA/tmRNA/rRNA uracil-C5-methylase (TrmA/RlmC/RlmD family)